MAGSTSHGLPSAADMFEQVREIPAYLRTEFTGVEKERNEGTGTSNEKETDLDLDLEKATNKQQKQRQGWDVSMMAPKLHSLEQQTAQQTALWSKPVNYDGESFTKASGKGTPAMSVEEFLDKGVGGAQLPRSR